MKNIFTGNKIVLILATSFVLSVVVAIVALVIPKDSSNQSTSPNNSSNTNTSPDGDNDTNTDANPDKDPDSDTNNSAIQPETGGTGTPVNQILVLSGWDTADNSGLSPGEIMPIRTQNQLIQAVLRDYISRNPTSEREIYGSISDARYQQSSHIFTIKIKSAIYTTSITTSGEINYIKDTNGDRNVAI